MAKKQTNSIIDKIARVKPRKIMDRLTPQQQQALRDVAEWARSADAIPPTGDMYRILVEETQLPLSLTEFRSWFHNASKK